MTTAKHPPPVDPLMLEEAKRVGPSRSLFTTLWPLLALAFAVVVSVGIVRVGSQPPLAPDITLTLKTDSGGGLVIGVGSASTIALTLEVPGRVIALERDPSHLQPVSLWEAVGVEDSER